MAKKDLGGPIPSEVKVERKGTKPTSVIQASDEDVKTAPKPTEVVPSKFTETRKNDIQVARTADPSRWEGKSDDEVNDYIDSLRKGKKSSSPASSPSKPAAPKPKSSTPSFGSAPAPKDIPTKGTSSQVDDMLSRTQSSGGSSASTRRPETKPTPKPAPAPASKPVATKPPAAKPPASKPDPTPPPKADRSYDAVENTRANRGSSSTGSSAPSSPKPTAPAARKNLAADTTNVTINGVSTAPPLGTPKERLSAQLAGVRGRDYLGDKFKDVGNIMRVRESRENRAKGLGPSETLSKPKAKPKKGKKK